MEQAKAEQNQVTTTAPPVSQPPVQRADEAQNTNPPCKAGEDLCAQWKAADAAKDSADWAKRSFWMVVVGTVIGVLTLIAAGAAAVYAGQAAKHTKTGADHAERSAKAAEDAIDVTREIGEAQARAYISVTKAWFENNAKALPKIIMH